MLTLILNILLLLIGVGGAIVSSLTLSNTRARFWWLTGFSVMGAIGLVLTVVTYENTADVPHLSDLVSKLAGNVSSFGRDYFWIWTLLCVAIGLALGACVSHFLPKRKRTDKAAPLVKSWLDPLTAIETYADPTLRTARDSRRAAAEDLKRQIDSIKREWDAEIQKLPFGPDPDHDPDLVADLSRRHKEAAVQLHQLGEEVWVIEREITKNVVGQLKEGKLVAKGFKQTKDSVAELTEIIPRDQWQLLKFDTYDTHMQTVRGGNWKYIGMQIGLNANGRH